MVEKSNIIDIVRKQTDRGELLTSFLAKNDLQEAERIKIKQDASFRSYERIKKDDGSSYILMDAPPGKEDIRPFIEVDNYLRQNGFSAPEIYVQDIKNGFLLLEDLGDNLYTTILSGDSSLSSNYGEYDLYASAIDVLIQLHRAKILTTVPEYDNDLLKKESNLLIDWYLPAARGSDLSPAMLVELKDEYVKLWEALYHLKKVSADVMVLRDYHADNLIWLPGRKGVKKVGLLDFQDAVKGSPVYDVVSLLEDARRDVSQDVVKAMIDRYLSTRKTIDRDAFMASYAVLAAQRNCKIIGIFARLAIRDKKTKYLNYLPRVWRHLQRNLEHPVLNHLKHWLDKALPFAHDYRLI